jgi:hypothetical protein
MMRQKLQMQLHTVEYQVERYYPRSHERLNELREKLITRIQKRNMERGIMEGLYRSDINTDIVAKIYYGKTVALMRFFHEVTDPEQVNKLMSEALQYHIRGIATLQGAEYLESKLKETSPTE